MIREIIEFKREVKEAKNSDNGAANFDKATMCKILVMLNIAEMVIRANEKVPEHERHYFEGQAFVGRYFGDWGLDFIVDKYLKVTSYIKATHW